MRTIVIACLLSMLLASPASASDTKWLALAIAGHSADYLSSVYFSTKPDACLESNPLARHADGTFDARKGAAALAATVTAEWLLLKVTRGKSSHMKVFGQAVVIGAGAAASVAATRNMMSGC